MFNSIIVLSLHAKDYSMQLTCSGTHPLSDCQLLSSAKDYFSKLPLVLCNSACCTSVHTHTHTPSPLTFFTLLVQIVDEQFSSNVFILFRSRREYHWIVLINFTSKMLVLFPYNLLVTHVYDSQIRRVYVNANTQMYRYITRLEILS